MDSMVGTTLTIEREIEDTWNTRDTGVGSKREDKLSPSRGRGRRLLLHMSFKTMARIGQLVRQGQVICYFCQQHGHMRRDCS